MDLDNMKYAELRGIAKELGLKGNMKADKLLKAIKQHYEREKNKGQAKQNGGDNRVEEEEEEGTTSPGSDPGDQPVPCEAYVSVPLVSVNTRRGKGTRTKRKTSRTETENDATTAPNAAESNSGVNWPEMPSDDTSLKRRRVSTKEAHKHEEQKKKDEAPVHQQADKPQKVTKTGKIPRLQKSKSQLKPITPNFKKLHEAQFNKMESIESYVQRKTKQMETYKVAAKDVKKATSARMTLFSPGPVQKAKAEEQRPHTLLSASKAPPKKSAGKEAAEFRPSVLSTRRINVRFSEATCDNEHKRSLVKTPARMSPCLTSSTPQKVAGVAGKTARMSFFSATKTPGPFVFTGNTSASTTPGTQKKTGFDLKASLSRPLTYKPHTGKLKPFAEAKENTGKDKSLVSNPHQEVYKQHKVQSRNDRRAKQNEGRKQKKENLLGARRGLVMI